VTEMRLAPSYPGRSAGRTAPSSRRIPARRDCSRPWHAVGRKRGADRMSVAWESRPSRSLRGLLAAAAFLTAPTALAADAFEMEWRELARGIWVGVRPVSYRAPVVTNTTVVRRGGLHGRRRHAGLPVQRLVQGPDRRSPVQPVDGEGQRITRDVRSCERMRRDGYWPAERRASASSIMTLKRGCPRSGSRSGSTLAQLIVSAASRSNTGPSRSSATSTSPSEAKAQPKL
jgi:hypothetical protein